MQAMPFEDSSLIVESVKVLCAPALQEMMWQKKHYHASFQDRPSEIAQNNRPSSLYISQFKKGVCRS